MVRSGWFVAVTASFQRKTFEPESTVEVPEVKAPLDIVRSPPIVEEAEVMRPTVVEVGESASAAAVREKVSFCLEAPPVNWATRPERIPPKVAVPPTAKVEEAPSEPPTSKVEPKVEEAEVMMPTVVVGRIASPAGVNCQSRFSKVMPAVAEPVKESASAPHWRLPEALVSKTLVPLHPRVCRSWSEPFETRSPLPKVEVADVD